jgi:hypothetical protein
VIDGADINRRSLVPGVFFYGSEAGEDLVISVIQLDNLTRVTWMSTRHRNDQQTIKLKTVDFVDYDDWGLYKDEKFIFPSHRDIP